MRLSCLAIAAGLTLVSLSTSLHGQRPQTGIDPRSLQLLAEGRAQRAGGQVDAANDTLETAVTVDPRTREAYLVMAQIASGRGLPGQAIRLYREALSLNGNDTAALRGQGEALVAKGAIAKAQENLGRIRTLCRASCADATALAAAIAKGPPVATAQAQTQVPPPRP
jgi:Tfp pilus assembly protein PilF